MKPSEIFSFNKTVFKNCLRQYWWWGMISVVLLLIILVIPVLSSGISFDMEDILLHPIILVYVFLSPLVLSILIFRVLHSESAMVFHLGLPIKRMAMTNSLLLAGLTLMLTPLYIILLFSLFTHGFNGNFMGDLALLLSVTLKNTIIMIDMFLIGVLISHLLGSTIGSFFIAIIIQFLPFTAYAISVSILTQLVYGMAIPYALDEILLRFLPLPLISISDLNFFWGSVWSLWYVLLIIILYVFIHITSCKRPVEMSKEFVSFNFLRPIFKWIMTVCGSLFIGTLILVAIDEYLMSFTGIIISFILGGLIGYIIGLLLLGIRKNIMSQLKPMIFYAIAVVAIIGVLKFDMFNFEDRIPIINEIEEAGVSITQWYGRSDVRYLSADEDYIRSIVKSHAEILEKRPLYGNTLIIKYKLSDDSEMIRKYNVSFNDIEQLSTVLSNDITLKNALKIYNLPSGVFGEIEINGVYENDYDFNLSRDQLAKLISLIQEDELMHANDSMRHYRMALAQIDYSYLERDGAVSNELIILRNYHKKAIEWLEDLDQHESAIFPYDKIEKVIINISDSKNLEVTDPKNIEFLIENSYDYQEDSSIYISVIKQGTDYPIYSGYISINVYETLKEKSN